MPKYRQSCDHPFIASATPQLTTYKLCVFFLILWHLEDDKYGRIQVLSVRTAGL